MRTVFLSVLCAIGFTAVMAGCGGGASSSAPSISSQASTAVPIPSSSPFSNATSQPAAVIGGTITVTASGGGFTSTMSLPVGLGFGNTSASTSISNSLPGGVSPLSKSRFTEGIRSAMSDGTTPAVLFVECVTFPVTVPLTAAPTFTIIAPQSDIIAGVAYYLALYNPNVNAWDLGYAGPATISGTTLTLAGAYAFTFPAGEAVCFALYAVSAASTPPTSAPAPTPYPTLTPSGPLSLTQTSFTFSATGQTGTFNAAETGFTGNFSAVSDNASIATVSPGTGTSFTITAGSIAGTATVTVSDGLGNTAPVTVSVTLTSGTIH